MKPTVCGECSAPMWICGAHSWSHGAWEVALICPNRDCAGWAIYNGIGKLATNRTIPLNAGISRMHIILIKAKEEKERRRIDKPQPDKGNVREYQNR